MSEWNWYVLDEFKLRANIHLFRVLLFPILILCFSNATFGPAWSTYTRMILRRCSYITSRQALPRKNTKRGGFLDLFGLGQCRNRSNSFDDKVKHVTVVMEPKKRGLSLSWCWKLELYSSSKLCVTLFKTPYRWDSNWKSSAQESCAVLVLVGITVFSIKSIFKFLKDFLPTMNFVTTCELRV